jgi:methylated-DNA-[protein]-cysteine S-methyltransferase
MTPTTEWLEQLAAAALEQGTAEVTYAHVDTPIGRLLIAQSQRGVCRVAFPEEETDEVLEEIARGIGPRIVRSERATAPVRAAVHDYLAGSTTGIDYPVDLTLMRSPFRRAVLKELSTVARGRVVTYGRLAALAGRPRAARAAGTACALNPVPIVVPCHRVVPSGGGVGSYGGGPERKRWLLGLEGVPAV